MKLSVKELRAGGKQHCLEVENDSVSVLDVKVRLGGMIALPMEQQSLVYNGKALSDSQRLCDYSIVDGAQLYVVSRPAPPTTEPAEPSEAEGDEPTTSAEPDQPWKNHTMHRNLLYLFLRDHFSVDHSKNIIGCYEKELRRIVYGTSLDLVELSAIESLKLPAAQEEYM